MNFFINNFPVIVLFFVFSLISVRNIGSVNLKIWLVMLSGALLVLLTGYISLASALKSINIDVMLFLFGMFIIGESLHKSGYLSHLAYKLFKNAKNVNQLVFFIIFSSGLLSALLMNDTIAIIGTPLVLYFSSKYKISAKLLLLALAFSVTIGSVMSPIGNPQNLLIAINGKVDNPFGTFLLYLGLPTLLNLFFTYLALKITFPQEFKNTKIEYIQEAVDDPKLAKISRFSLLLVTFLIILRVMISVLKLEINLDLIFISLISAAPIMLFSKRRIEIIKNIDWSTLIFFAAMFILMASVWDTGFFQRIMTELHLDIASTPVILSVSIILSQLISNVPFVALYIPLLNTAGSSNNALMALAAGSTIAGNLFILGAASNVIIVQNAEKKGETLTFLEFARIGIPLTVINTFIYYCFL